MASRKRKRKKIAKPKTTSLSQAKKKADPVKRAPIKRVKPWTIFKLHDHVDDPELACEEIHIALPGQIGRILPTIKVAGPRLTEEEPIIGDELSLYLEWDNYKIEEMKDHCFRLEVVDGKAVFKLFKKRAKNDDKSTPAKTETTAAPVQADSSAGS